MAKKMRAKNQFSADDGRAFFRRLIKEGPWAPIYLLTGEERYLVHEAIERLTRAVFPNGPDDFNEAHFDAREDTAPDTIAACEVLPIMASKRVVRLRNIDAWKVADLELLADYCDDPAQSTLLIIDGASLPKRSKAAKRIHASAHLAAMQFGHMNAAETAKWIARRAKHYHLRVTRTIAQQIVEQVGEDLETLDHALEKLMLFARASDKEVTNVTKTMIDETIVDARMRSVFELTDALARRDIQRAIPTYRRMRLHGDSPLGVVSMIAREFRGMLTATLGRRSQQPDPTIAQTLSVPPWTIKKYVQRARAFQEDELRNILMRTTQTAAALTSSRLKDDLHVERLILQICRPAPRAQRRPVRKTARRRN